MERKSFRFELKTSDDATGEFTGYLAVFGNVDGDSDVVVKGAFKVSIASKRTIVVLWQHDQREPIGKFLELTEDDHGLLVKGKLAIDTQQGARAWSLLKMGAISGLSIGYIAVQAERDKQKGIRYLKECKLMEGSIVTFPANEEAVVTDVKNATTKRVDGCDLPASAFAYVGDPEKTDTWKLPIHFPTPDLSATHIRNALSWFSETDGIPESERPKVLARIHAAADSHGIDKNKAARSATEIKMKTFSDALAARQTEQDLREKRWDVEDAKQDSLESIMSDGSMSVDEKKKAARKTLHDAADAHADILEKAIDAAAAESADYEDEGEKGGNAPLEVKRAKKAIGDAVALHAEAERKCMKAMDLLHQASQMHTKGIMLASQLSYAGANKVDDKVPAVPVGGKASAAEIEDLASTVRAARSNLKKTA